MAIDTFAAFRKRPLLLAVFLSSMPGTIILPMMPSLGEKYGLDGIELGILFAIYPLMSVIAAPVWGRLSDRYGRRPVLLATLAAGTAAFVMFGLSGSFAALLASRAFQGLAGSTRGIGFAVMGDVTTPDQRAAGMGYVSASMAAGFTTGPLLGAVFLGENPGPLLGGLRDLLGIAPAGFDHLLPSLVGAALNFAGFWLILRGFDETRGAEARAAAAEPADGGHGPVARSLVTLALTILVAQFLVSGFLQGSMQFAFTLWANNVLDWDAQRIALAIAAMGLAFVIATGLMLRPLTARFGNANTVLIGALIDIAGLALFISQAGGWMGAVGGLFLSAMGGGIWVTTILGLVSHEADEDQQGLVLGIANGAGLIGRVAGPPVAGLLIDRYDPLTPFWVMLACMGVILARATWLARRLRAT